MRGYFLCFMAVLCFVALPAQAQTGTYERIVKAGEIQCGYIPWDPYYIVDLNTGEVSGIGKDFTDLIFKLLNIKVTYVEATLGNEVTELNAKKYDAVCGVGPWVISKLRELNYAKGLYYFPVYAYARADESRFKTLEDLNKPDVTFVGLDEDLTVELAELRFPEAKVQTLQSITDPAQMMLNVATGKADIVLLDPLTVESYNDKNEAKLKPLFNKKLIAVYPDSFALRKDDLVLLETLNETVQSAHETGLTQAIFDRYPEIQNNDYLLLPNEIGNK